VRSSIAIAALVAAGVLPVSASLAGEPKGVDTHSDFGVTLAGPGETSVGGRAAYEMVITNAGPDRSEPKLRFTHGRGATAQDFDRGDPIRTYSQTASKGECNTDTHGVVCRPGAVDPGQTVEVEVVVKVLETDMPKLHVQATVAPELVPEFDANPANDHAETATAVRAPITVDGVPDGCARQPFKVAVKTDVPKAKKTKVLVDNKVLDTTASSKLTVTVKPKDLERGSHKLAVVVQGGGGPPLATLKETFKTC
jgi:hypothetical protein